MSQKDRKSTYLALDRLDLKKRAAPFCRVAPLTPYSFSPVNGKPWQLLNNDFLRQWNIYYLKKN